jgi:hypothetical protein
MFATHQEFQTVLCSILKNFLNCVEGLRTLNGNIPEVLKDIQSITGAHHPVNYSLIPSVRPPVSPSELTVKHDSLFDTLSSSAESANVLTSRVISARAGQHVKLDFHEFLETFNECWNFVVRCEIICRRMIVGLRGAVVSQVPVEARSWRHVGLTYLDRPSHSSRYYTRRKSASLPSWSVGSLARSILSLLTNTTIAVYLQTCATCTRNSPCSKLPACQLPSSKHSLQTRAEPLHLSPHANNTHTTLAPATTPQQRPARWRGAARHYANEAALTFLQRAHQGHTLAQQHCNTRTSTPRNQAGFKQVIVPLSPTLPVNGEPWEPGSKSPSKNAHAEADVGP